MFNPSLYLPISLLMAATISSGVDAQTAATSFSRTVGSSTPTSTQSLTTKFDSATPADPTSIPAPKFSIVPTAAALTEVKAPIAPLAPPTPIIAPLQLQSIPLPSNIKVAPVNLPNGAVFSGYTIVK
jgi:hypothetical protein